MSHEDLTPQQRQGIIAHEVGHATPQRIMPEIIGIMPVHPGTTTAGLITNTLTIDGHPITNEYMTEDMVAPHQVLVDGREAHTSD